GVCLLSPSYLHSEYCLRELEMFRAQGKPIILLDWIPVRVEDMPETLLNASRFSASPQGLRALLRLKSSHDSYQVGLSEIAFQIVGIAQSKSAVPATHHPAEIPFIILAERNDHIRTVRSNARPYGTRRRDWKP